MLVEVLAGPVLHVGVKRWLAEGGVRVLVSGTCGRPVVVVFTGDAGRLVTRSVMLAVLGRVALLRFGFQRSCLEKERWRNMSELRDEEFICILTAVGS